MECALPTANEKQRLKALRAYGILDTPPEEAFEHITSLAMRLFRVPVAAVTLVDADRQWFKSVRGMDIRETPRDVSFCAHAMWDDDVFTIPDTRRDPRFADNPLTQGEKGWRFYAGAALRAPEGQPLGALCLADYKPRHFGQAEKQALRELAALVQDEMLLRRVSQELHRAKRSNGATKGAPPNGEKSENGVHANGSTKEGYAEIHADRKEAAWLALDHHSRQLIEQASDAIFVYDLAGNLVDVNKAACDLTGYARAELLRLKVADIELSFDPDKSPQRWGELAVGESFSKESLNRRKDGGVFPAEARVSVVETDQGRLLLALVRDISERKLAEESLRVRVQQQQAIARLGTEALSGRDLDALCHDALQIVSGSLNLELCAVLEYMALRKEFVIRVGLNLPKEKRGVHAAPDQPEFAASHVLHTGEPVIIRNYATEKRFQRTVWQEEVNVVCGLSVPIGGDGSGSPRYGVLAAYSAEWRDFSADDVYFVQSVANVLAAAIARRRGEDALRVVEARYQRIVTNTPGMVYQHILHADGSVSMPFVSEGSRQVLGLDPERLRENPQLALASVHPDERRHFAELIRESETQLRPLHWEGRHLLPDGQIRWMRVDSRPERLPDGAVICDGIMIDITEQKQTQEALRQSEERFRLANFHSPFPVMLHTDDGEVLQVNDAWTHITGYMPQELRRIDDWLQRAYSQEEAREKARGFIARLKEYVGPVECRGMRVRCLDGSERLWDFSCSNLGRLPDGRWLHLTTATDVTARRRNEEELRLAKEEAERANTAKSVFLSRMSHELRTPLNAILGFGQVLELGKLSEQDTQCVSYILKGGRHLLALVDDVLDLARVESGEIALKLTAVTFGKLMQECTGLVAKMAQAREIACMAKLGPACRVPVWADEQRLRQVLLNLLSNAIKYNKEGGQVTLSCRQMPNGRVRCVVRDTGPGISAEGLARLFVPFERLGQEYGDTEGSGLGLVVSRRLAEAMGGTVGAESQPEAGSTFWVEIPAAQAEEEAPPPSNFAAALALAQNARELAAATILYVEDNVSNLQVIKTVAERLRPNWRVLSAMNGVEGLQLAREARPDAVLLDLQLPGMKGDAVLTELRADARTADVPVLLLSADATARSRDRLLALGATDYLPKPFNVAELLAKIDALVSTTRKKEERREF